MKTNSVSTFFAMLVSASLLMNCTNKKNETTTDHEGMDHASSTEAPMEAGAPTFEVSEDFQKQLAAVFTSYVVLKDGLVATDASKTKAAAAKVQAALANVDMSLVEGPAHHDWMNYLGELQTSLATIAASDDIEAQRSAFSTLSDNLYKSIKAFGLSGTTAYYEYCPMAFNNTGGYWLSDVSEIRNPYFGDKMLTCGSVQEQLN